MWSSLDTVLGVLFMFVATGIVVVGATVGLSVFAWLAGREFAEAPPVSGKGDA